MILNEDYFDDLEIKDEDIVADDTMPDVEEPKHELTLEEFHKLPEQYSHQIVIKISHIIAHKLVNDTTFSQTTLIPKLFKRFDTIFESYGIEHSEYVLRSWRRVDYDTIVEFGDYQLFCDKSEEYEYINDTYDCFFINVYVNYPQFTYKRAFRFLYTLVLNLYRMNIRMFVYFKPNTDDYTSLDIDFDWPEPNDIKFSCREDRTEYFECDIDLCDVEYITEKDKRLFYKSVFYHFFKKEIKVPYKLLERDVPLKSYITNNLLFCSRTT